MSNSKVNLWLGLFLVVIGILGNKWTAEFLFASDGQIDSRESILGIALFQVSTITAGLYFLLRRPFARHNALKIIIANALVFLFLLLLLEAGGQIVSLLRPSYDVLFLQPDKELGWKQVPNLSWTWAGHNWYAMDFSVQVQTNALGFRDIARELIKPADVNRVAVIGDSFIEAVQVPFENTAGQLLERKLNDLQKDMGSTKRNWEVLNFGISNYGIGQYLLTWEQYAAKYDPDYVVIFVAYFHMRRTVMKHETGGFPKSAKERLWVRPVFTIENDSLVKLPAKHFDRFVAIQEDLVQTEFKGLRTRKRRMLVTLHYAKRLLSHVKRPWKPATDVRSVDNPEALQISLKVIEFLGRNVKRRGGQLVVLDASQYFGDTVEVSEALRELCTGNEFGYIPLYERLLEANSNEISTRWAHDGHFNEIGNMILADALYDWLTKKSHPVGTQ